MKSIMHYISLATVILIIILQSCNKSGKSGVPRSQVIPEDKMVEILSDMYMVDGLMNYPPIRSDFSNKDTTENYSDVISKHAYSKQDVDLSVRYYFIDKPKKYADIYDRVIKKLSGMEAEVIQKLSSEDIQRNENLWNGASSYNIPDVGVIDPVEFSIRTVGLGEYVIKARILLYEDDQSIDPHSQVWFWYDDGTEEGVKIPWDRKDLVKSGRPVMISMSKELDDPRVTHIKGRLLNHTDQPGHWEKHALVTNITVNRIVDEEELMPPG
ncbi:MAG: DUF4296 domain-containing protein [Bacteroidales bacterium]|nr:DUF4296 domain-containing protein [Bacteroidales bacterium]